CSLPMNSALSDPLRMTRFNSNSKARQRLPATIHLHWLAEPELFGFEQRSSQAPYGSPQHTRNSASSVCSSRLLPLLRRLRSGVSPTPFGNRTTAVLLLDHDGQVPWLEPE